MPADVGRHQRRSAREDQAILQVLQQRQRGTAACGAESRGAVGIASCEMICEMPWSFLPGVDTKGLGCDRQEGQGPSRPSAQSSSQRTPRRRPRGDTGCPEADSSVLDRARMVLETISGPPVTELGRPRRDPRLFPSESIRMSTFDEFGSRGGRPCGQGGSAPAVCHESPSPVPVATNSEKTSSRARAFLPNGDLGTL